MFNPEVTHQLTIKYRGTGWLGLTILSAHVTPDNSINNLVRALNMQKTVESEPPSEERSDAKK